LRVAPWWTTTALSAMASSSLRLGIETLVSRWDSATYACAGGETP
jgi:hypothetical protein